MTDMKINITLFFKNCNKIFGKLPSSMCYHGNKRYTELNLTNIYDVYNSHNFQTVTLNKRKCYATISLPISIKHIIRGPNGGLILIILGTQGGAKNRKLFGKKSKLSYKLKLIVTKLF